MGKYCDTKTLEMNWYDWLVASAAPDLEKYRILGLLWTKVPGSVLGKNGKPIIREGVRLSNPCFPHRLHCLALAKPVFFDSYNTAASTSGTIGCPKFGKKINLEDLNNDLNLESDNELYMLDDQLAVLIDTIPRLISLGYRRDQPTDISWHAMLKDINNMCIGIASKFNPSSTEELEELAHDALVQVINKLTKRKLVYTPGRAPVFNLLTTTIYRCMYSIKNKARNQRNGFAKLADQIQAKSLNSLRSFRLAHSQ